MLRKCIIGLLFLFCSCAPKISADYINSNGSEIDISLTSPISDVFVGKQQDLTVPVEIPEEVFPVSDVYYIRTRVVIEIATIDIPIDNEKSFTTTMRAFTKKEIEEYFKIAEKVYEKVGLKFHIEQYVFHDYNLSTAWYWLDAARYSDYLSVYFLMKRPYTPFAGLSSAPWEKYPWGILMFPGATKWTLSHELGHYFGLLHPFQKGENGDYVDDTPPQKKTTCYAEKGGTPNCGNIMNYCNHFSDKDFPFITVGQRNRMRRFLRAKRREEVIEKPPRSSLRLEDVVFGKVLSVSMVPSTQPSD